MKEKIIAISGLSAMALLSSTIYSIPVVLVASYLIIKK